jgi:Flp pilus assembly protein TadG
MRLRIGRRYLRDQNGASSAEFVLVLIPFLTIFLGIIGVSMLMYANHTLQYAVEAAARCYAVNVATCPSTGATQTYAASRYGGPTVAPTFVASATGCGHTVTGTVNFNLKAAIVNVTIPLSATACFP